MLRAIGRVMLLGAVIATPAAAKRTAPPRPRMAARAIAALRAEPRTVVTDEQSLYLRAECRSRIFRFVDDVEIVIDSAAHVLRFRSASRVGGSDMGVNRKRMSRISERLLQPSSTSTTNR